MINLNLGREVGVVGGRGHEEGIGRDTFDRWEARYITVSDEGVAKENTGVVIVLRDVSPPTHKLFDNVMHRCIAIDTRTFKLWYLGGGA